MTLARREALKEPLSFPIVKIHIDEMDIPSYHDNRSPFLNPKRRHKLHQHLNNKGGRFCQELADPILLCGPNPRGKWDIIDGVGRKWMAIQASNPVEGLDSKCLPYRPPAQQIALFAGRGTQRTNITKDDIFVAIARAGGSPNKEIVEMLEQWDFRVGYGCAKGLRMTTACALFGYENGVLKRVLKDITETAWGLSLESRKKLITPHIAAVMALHIAHPNLDIDHLHALLNATNVQEMASEAVSQARDTGIKLPRARHFSYHIARGLLLRYNKGRKGVERPGKVRKYSVGRLSEMALKERVPLNHDVYDSVVPKTRVY